MDTAIGTLGYLKTVDGVYITETELNTALDFYNTTAEVAEYATTYYEQKADLDVDVAALGFLKTIDGVYITETELTTTLGDYATIANADAIL